MIALAGPLGGAAPAHAASYTGTAADCLLQSGPARDVCVSLIESVRRAMQGGRSYGDFRACSPHPIEDKRDTEAVIEWIRKHPDRQDQDVNSTAREALSALYPCSS
jgi:hypothetical protein